MVEETLLIGLVVERVKPGSQWADPSWRPAAVFPVPPDTPLWTPLGKSGDNDLFYAGPQTVTLYSTETANYQTNLAAGPKLWVVLRAETAEPPLDVVAVTADPAEGEAFTETGTDIVETIAMPLEISAVVSAFVENHHVERPFFKRRRDSREMDVIGGKPERKGEG